MTTTIGAPVVTRDPRFSAGRKLVERGLADEAIAVYATLLEETTQQYGGDSIEAAPAYYEYGNSLLRARAKREAAAAAEEEEEQQQDAAAETETAREEQRASAAAAAERRQQAARGNDETTADQKPAADPQSANTNENENENDDGGASGDPENDPPSDPANQRSNDDDNNKNNNNNDGDNDDDDDDDDDRELALEMMENSFSILEEYNDRDREQGEDPTPGEDRPYAQWVREQLPRVLLGLGDTLSTLDRHADAADAYSRALEWRRAHLQELEDRVRSHATTMAAATATTTATTTAPGLEHLSAHRRVCEASLLIAEALLACPPGADVVATETGSLIVTASERVSYARGYYDQARDALQEAVVAMGALPRTVDLGREKEDVCFLATLVMGVGETLAAIDEQGQDQDQDQQQAAEGAAGSTEPARKKAKRG